MVTRVESERLVAVETKVDYLTERANRMEGKIDLLVDRTSGWDGMGRFMRYLPPFVAVMISVVALLRAW